LISTVFELEVTVLSATGADNSNWAAAGSGEEGKLYGVLRKTATCRLIVLFVCADVAVCLGV
jgi:hypothetical protein